MLQHLHDSSVSKFPRHHEQKTMDALYVRLISLKRHIRFRKLERAFWIHHNGTHV